MIYDLDRMTNPAKVDYIIKENLDITDDMTKKVIYNINEADKTQLLSSLTNKLYQDIVDKVDEIDFGTIPMSRGDFTKVDNYQRIVECVGTIKDILVQYKQDTKDNIDVVADAINNMIAKKDLFIRGYQLNLELPIVMYNTISLSIISAVSFMISSVIEFVKSPNRDSFDTEVDKVALTKTKENVLFTNLKKFNIACKTRQLDNTIEFVIKNRVKNFTGFEIGLTFAGIAMIGIILNIIPIIRELIFFFYYSRTKVSDYFEIQADLLQMNAYNVQNNGTMKKTEKDAIVKKQLKIVDKFRKISNKIGIDNKAADVNSAKEIARVSNNKYKYSDLSDSLPDSVASSDIF